MGAPKKSGRKATYGESFATHQLRQWVSDYQIIIII